MDDRHLAELLAREGGQAALRLWRTALHVEFKSNLSNPVTEADRQAEQIIAELIAAVRPADGILGEEGSDRPGKRRWVVDPVDGTSNFSRGLDFWSTGVALRHQGRTVTSAIYAPVRDLLWSAGVGRGVCCNGEMIEQRSDRTLARAVVNTYIDPLFWAREGMASGTAKLIEASSTLRIQGSLLLELVQAAEGCTDLVAVVAPQPWDWHAGAHLIRANGGATVEHPGGWHLAGAPTAVAEAAALLAVSA